MSSNQNVQQPNDVSVNTVPKQLMFHYQTIAYALALTAYAFSFGEYLFLRLTHILNPENIIQHSSCAADSSGYQMVVGKGAINYAVIIVAFISVAIFQITCFFGLTISEKWVKYRPDNTNDPVTKLRVLLSQRIRNTMEITIYPTFACYALASASVWLIIFYMVGIRDSIDELASTISLYIFDAIILIYFFVFPIITYIYHPYLRKRSALAMLYAIGAQNNNRTNHISIHQDTLPTTGYNFAQPITEIPTVNRFPSWLNPPRTARCLRDEQTYARNRMDSLYDQPYHPSVRHPEFLAAHNCNGRITSTV